jgi:hypothetical protein
MLKLLFVVDAFYWRASSTSQHLVEGYAPDIQLRPASIAGRDGPPGKLSEPVIHVFLEFLEEPGRRAACFRVHDGWRRARRAGHRCQRCLCAPLI